MNERHKIIYEHVQKKGYNYVGPADIWEEAQKELLNEIFEEAPTGETQEYVVKKLEELETTHNKDKSYDRENERFFKFIDSL